MFRALLAHHQGAHTCIKQSSELSIIPNVCNCHKFVNMQLQRRICAKYLQKEGLDDLVIQLCSP
jgi:hypothetical protein